MSRPILSNLCHDAERRLAALLTAERCAGEPSEVDQQRVWGALEGRLVAAGTARPNGRWWRRGLVVAALVAGAGGLVGSGLGSEPATVETPVAIELPAPSRPRVVVPTVQSTPSAPGPAPVAVVEDVQEPPRSKSAEVVESTRPRRRVAPSLPAREPQPDATSTLAEQLELIRAARQALEHGRASVAIGHVERYRSRFATGVLAEEAEGIATAARCAQGEDAAATREAFATRWPSSIHGKLVERFCRD